MNDSTIIAWINSEGVPVPIRLHCIQVGDRTIEKIVSMPINRFPWHEIEAFAIELQMQGFRLIDSEESQTNNPPS
jgi:hypothetical protein